MKPANPEDNFMVTSLKVLLQTPEKNLYLSRQQMERFNFSPGERVNLEIGVASNRVTVVSAPSNILSKSLHVSSAVADAIPYYQGEPLSLVFASPGRLSLGPTLGVGVSRSGWQNIESKGALKKRALLAHSKGILLYFFRLASVNWKANTVQAYSLDPAQKTWVQQTVPVPEVIYDRGSAPGPNTVHGFTSKGAVRDLLWLNATRTFSKWDTYQALRPQLRTPPLPETALLSVSSIKDFLGRYASCYVKSSFGRNGKQVGRIVKDDRGYVWQSGGSETKTQVFSDLESLYKFLMDTLGDYLIIQQGLRLGKIDHSPFDMRVLVQKNAKNRWVVNGVNLRIGAPGAIVTNFAAGARHMFFNPEDPLPHDGLSWKRITDVALDIAQSMEPKFGRLGEMGLDLGLDQDDKLWLIEVNSRPSSIAYSTVQDWGQIFGCPLDYAAYLVRKKRLATLKS